jgi:hypothetical protein
MSLLANTVTERRIVRALRDAAAFKIAAAYVDHGKPFADDVSDFERHRFRHNQLLEEESSDGRA